MVDSDLISGWGDTEKVFELLGKDNIIRISDKDSSCSGTKFANAPNTQIKEHEKKARSLDQY